MQSVSEEEEENGRVAECHRGAGVLHGGVLAVTVAVAAAVHSTVSKFWLLLTNICSFRLHTQH